MMMTKNRKPRWYFYPTWVLLSTISIPIAAFITWAFVTQVEKVVGGTIQVGGQPRFLEDYLGVTTLLIVLGLVTGLLQYLLLRGHLPRMGWWIPATVLGLLLSLVGGRLLISTLYSRLDPTWFGILGTGLLGGSVGLFQWLLLRQRVRHAGWWILANVLGWGVVGWGAMTLSNQMLIPAVGILLVPGIATSIVLWLLLDRLSQGEGSEMNPPLSRRLEYN